MFENKSLERLSEIKADQILVESIGHPSEKVIESIKKAVACTLNKMKYLGEIPNVIVSDGELYSASGALLIACYDFEATPSVIRIGEPGIKRYWEGVKSNTPIPDDIMVLVIASHETVHFIQDQRGALPHEGNNDSSGKPFTYHDSQKHEIEADNIAFTVTNDILGYEFIKRNEK